MITIKYHGIFYQYTPDPDPNADTGLNIIYMKNNRGEDFYELAKANEDYSSYWFCCDNDMQVRSISGGDGPIIPIEGMKCYQMSGIIIDDMKSVLGKFFDESTGSFKDPVIPIPKISKAQAVIWLEKHGMTDADLGVRGIIDSVPDELNRSRYMARWRWPDGPFSHDNDAFVELWPILQSKYGITQSREQAWREASLL